MDLYRVRYVHRQNLHPSIEEAHIGVTEKVAFVVGETDREATAHIASDPHNEIMGATLVQKDVQVAVPAATAKTPESVTSKRRW